MSQPETLTATPQPEPAAQREAALRALLADARPRPWETGDGDAPFFMGYWAIVGPHEDREYPSMCDGKRIIASLNSNFPPEAEARLIVAAVNTLEEHLDELAALRRQLDDAATEIAALRARESGGAL